MFDPRGADYKGDDAPTRDHILPKERGGKLLMHGDTRNARIICAACNYLLGACFHCVGVAACVRSVAADERQNPYRVIRAWGISKRVGRLRAGIALDAVRKKRSEPMYSLVRSEPTQTLGDVWGLIVRRSS
jgi:hypothetical protein